MIARNRKTRVLVIKSNYGRTGGAETLLSSLLKHLDKKRFELTLLKLSHDLDYKLPTFGGTATLAIDERMVRWKGYLSASEAIRQIKKTVRDLEIDVVYTHDMRADLIGCALALLTRARWVSHVHGWLGATANAKTRFHEWMDGRLIAKADLVLVGSEKLRTEIETRCRCRAIGIVPNSIDPDILKAERTRVQTLRDRLGLREAGHLIGTVGRLHRGKGHDILLRACATLRENYPSLRCVIVGEGPWRSELEALANQLGLSETVTFTGYCESVVDWLAALDVFVTCSLTESLPITVLEAMALGRPVVATDVGDVRPVLDHGKAGVVVAPGSVEAAAQAIASLLNEPQTRKQLAENGRRRVLAAYSIERAAREVEKHLTSACNV